MVSNEIIDSNNYVIAALRDQNIYMYLHIYKNQ